MRLAHRFITGSLLLLLAAIPARAQADGNIAADARAKLAATLKQRDVRHYTRQCPNGAQRLVINASRRESLSAIAQATGPGSNVLQICHIDPKDYGQPGLMHTLALFDGKNPHFQYIGANWRLNSWGGGQSLRPSTKRMYSALIQLTPSEGNRLRTMLGNAEKEQGPWDYALNNQQNYEKGHVKGALGQRGFNCTSVWSGMPVGDKGETLAQLCGLRGASGSPHGFQRDLERDANDRVFGIAVYGPRVKGFGTDKNKNHVFDNGAQLERNVGF